VLGEIEVEVEVKVKVEEEVEIEMGVDVEVEMEALLDPGLDPPESDTEFAKRMKVTGMALVILHKHRYPKNYNTV